MKPRARTDSPETAAAAGAPPRLEAWALDLILANRLEGKRCPPPPGATLGAGPPLPVPDAPGRPPQLRVTRRSPRTPKGLRSRQARARLLHVFAHHELQAAELFARALLAFPEAPEAFRRGLARLAGEELAHFERYLQRLGELGAAFGDDPVRDWFWERVPACDTVESFTAFMGLGLEGANLEHSERFRRRFEEAGDAESAALLADIERDEIGHVAFAKTWFEQFTGRPLDYDRWAEHLPQPLTPALLRSRPLNRSARARAGLPTAFVAALDACGDTLRPSARPPRP